MSGLPCEILAKGDGKLDWDRTVRCQYEMLVPLIFAGLCVKLDCLYIVW